MHLGHTMVTKVDLMLLKTENARGTFDSDILLDAFTDASI